MVQRLKNEHYDSRLELRLVDDTRGGDHLSEASCSIAAKLNLLVDTIVKCTVCTRKLSNNQALFVSI